MPHFTLAKIPERTNRGGRPPTYPWDDWFDPEHNARTLVPGKDFTVPLRSFRSAARQAAASRGLEVKVVGIEDGVLLVYAPEGELGELLAG